MKSLSKFFVFLLLMSQACTDGDPRTVDVGQDYWPLQKGLYQIYNVHEVIFNGINDPDTTDYQVMTEVVDSFPNASNSFTYVIYRSRRADENSPWQYLDTRSAQADAFRAIATEGGKPFVKLVFPVKVGREWNGNEFNTSEPDTYELIKVNEPYAVGTSLFNETVKVNQEDNQDFIVYQDKRFEVYAKQVGLVYQETIQLKYCTQQDCLGQQKVESGIIYIQSILSYGKK